MIVLSFSSDDCFDRSAGSTMNGSLVMVAQTELHLEFVNYRSTDTTLKTNCSVSASKAVWTTSEHISLRGTSIQYDQIDAEFSNLLNSYMCHW